MKTLLRPRHKKNAPLPAWIEPMKATLTDDRFSKADWLFEPKLDGIRCIAYTQNKEVTLYSRRKLVMNETYPEIVEALQKQKLSSFILDGEIVAFRPNSTVTSFETLQQRSGIHDASQARLSPVRVYFYVFDLLYADGKDWRPEPLIERKKALEGLIQFSPLLRFTPHRTERGEAYYAEACRSGWEGLIAKRQASPYQSHRSSDWLKFKCVKEQEFVIGGFSDPEGGRNHFGALLLGHYDDEGHLCFAGKVGTGFNQDALSQLITALHKLEQKSSPYQTLDIPRRGLHWVKPILVAQIGFAEWTQDGKLRQPRFKGLRSDKEPREVTREKSIPAGGRHGA